MRLGLGRLLPLCSSVPAAGRLRRMESFTPGLSSRRICVRRRLRGARHGERWLRGRDAIVVSPTRVLEVLLQVREHPLVVDEQCRLRPMFRSGSSIDYLPRGGRISELRNNLLVYVVISGQNASLGRVQLSRSLGRARRGRSSRPLTIIISDVVMCLETLEGDVKELVERTEEEEETGRRAIFQMAMKLDGGRPPSRPVFVVVAIEVIRDPPRRMIASRLEVAYGEVDDHVEERFQLVRNLGRPRRKLELVDGRKLVCALRDDG